MSSVHKLLRPGKKFPHVWCAGCGHGIVFGALLRAIEKLELDPLKVVLVSGIGCASRAPVYANFNSIHSLHGRALSFATGVKAADPSLHVIVITGDGDATAIGGNHFIHSCRRNIDLTTIVFNNNIYGMTGGQYSPTTPYGDISKTTPLGNVDQGFDICNLAESAGATFVARGAAYYARMLEKLLTKGLCHNGMSVIDVISQCHTYYGRPNKLGSAVDMLQWQKENAVNKTRWEKMSEKERVGKTPTGIFVERQAPEFTQAYRILSELAQRKGI